MFLHILINVEFRIIIIFLLVSISCWEEMTPYQEKFGNIPDHCKVPIFNLKTRKIKILDFEEFERRKKDKILE